MGHQRDHGGEQPAREADNHTGSGEAGSGLRGELDTVRRASAVESLPGRPALTDRMRSFLTGRRICIAGTQADERPVVEPCIDDAGFLSVAGDTVAWPATALADERRSLVEPGERRSLSLFVADWPEPTAALRVAGTATRQPSPPSEGTASPTDRYVLEVADARFDRDPALPNVTLGHAPNGDRTESDRTTYDRLVAAAEQVVCTQRFVVLGTPTADSAPRLTPLTGPPGFVQVLNAHTLAWPVYRDAVPVGPLQESDSATLLFVASAAGSGMVQVSGRVSRYDSVAGAADPSPGDQAQDWLLMDVERATVSRDPPLPSLAVDRVEPPWASDG